jgi:LAS superfamily LD-carboxypeptidase LdcB
MKTKWKNRFFSAIRRHWGLILITIFLIIGIAYGLHQYLLLRDQNRELQATITQLRTTIQALQGNLSLTAYERDHLSFVLDETQHVAQELQTQTDELEDKVQDFEKLNSIDPELLKKYSKVYFLNEQYAPSSLENIDAKFINGAGRVLQFHAQALPYLTALLEDSTDEGLSLRVTSAYRSFSTQATLKAGYKVTYGAGTANQFSADQGYSEHQLGTTVDFTSAKTGTLNAAFDTTPESKWLIANAHRYGFILSYPKNNKYYIYEPWHWRFVGVELATHLHNEGKYLYDIDQRDLDPYLLHIFD